MAADSQEKQSQSKPIGEDRYKTKDTNLESGVWSLESGRLAIKCGRTHNWPAAIFFIDF